MAKRSKKSGEVFSPLTIKLFGDDVKKIDGVASVSGISRATIVRMLVHISVNNGFLQNLANIGADK